MPFPWSHEPKRRSYTMSTPEQQISAAIKEAIADNEVIVFMKGTPDAPR